MSQSAPGSRQLEVYCQKNNPDNKDRGNLRADRVPLNARGNQLLAEERWKAIKVYNRYSFQRSIAIYQVIILFPFLNKNVFIVKQ